MAFTNAQLLKTKVVNGRSGSNMYMFDILEPLYPFTTLVLRSCAFVNAIVYCIVFDSCSRGNVITVIMLLKA